MDGIWQNGKYVLASTLEDRETRLRKENQAMKEALEEILDYSAISDSLDIDLEKYRKGTSSYHPNVLRALHKAKQALTLANGGQTL